MDPFSVSLHRLIQRANVSSIWLRLQHVIAPGFFWLPDTPKSASFWPNLKEIDLVISPATPDGDWYFMGDPNIASYAEFSGAAAGEHDNDDSRRAGAEDGHNNTVHSISDSNDSDSGDTADNNHNVSRSVSDNSESDSGDAEDRDYNTARRILDSDDSDSINTVDRNVNTSRNIPNPAKMNPLLLAMARAVQHAPSLQRINIYFLNDGLLYQYLKDDAELQRQFDIYYFARGVVDRGFGWMVDSNRLVRKVGDYRLDEEVERQWRDALGQDGEGL
jgi:hypothetical protein